MKTAPIMFGGLLLLAASKVAMAASLVIGVGAPLSGVDAVFGNQVKLGVEQAASDLNDRGGVNGQSVRVALGDDGGDPNKAVAVAKRFAAQHLPFVVGHFSSAATVPASAVYAANGMIDITPSATAPLVTDRDLATVFRDCGRDDEQGAVAARFLLRRHVSRVAIVHDRTAAGKRLADAVRADLNRAGVREVFYNGVDKGTRDYGGLVGRLKAASAQVVFFGGSGADAGLLARQLRDANARAILMGGDDLASDDFVAHAGNAAEGSIMIFPQDPKTRPAAAGLLRRLRDRGLEPGAYVFYAYAAVQAFADAAQRAGSTDPAKVAAELHGGRPFDTVLGPLSFDHRGDPTVTDYAVFVWHKGSGGHLTFEEQARS